MGATLDLLPPAPDLDVVGDGRRHAPEGIAPVTRECWCERCTCTCCNTVAIKWEGRDLPANLGTSSIASKVAEDLDAQPVEGSIAESWVCVSRGGNIGVQHSGLVAGPFEGCLASAVQHDSLGVVDSSGVIGGFLLGFIDGERDSLDTALHSIGVSSTDVADQVQLDPLWGQRQAHGHNKRAWQGAPSRHAAGKRVTQHTTQA